MGAWMCWEHRILSHAPGLALLKRNASLLGAWHLLSPKLFRRDLLLLGKDTNDDRSYMR
jgi:hypothetical protein